MPGPTRKGERVKVPFAIERGHRPPGAACALAGPRSSPPQPSGRGGETCKVKGEMWAASCGGRLLRRADEAPEANPDPVPPESPLGGRASAGRGCGPPRHSRGHQSLPIPAGSAFLCFLAAKSTKNSLTASFGFFGCPNAAPGACSRVCFAICDRKTPGQSKTARSKPTGPCADAFGPSSASRLRKRVGVPVRLGPPTQRIANHPTRIPSRSSQIPALSWASAPCLFLDAPHRKAEGTAEAVQRAHVRRAEAQDPSICRPGARRRSRPIETARTDVRRRTGTALAEPGSARLRWVW